MTSLPSEPTVPMFAQEQFRMRKLQVFNWGTFSGVHDIPISERGFLFVGPSGSGKSTLLDAFSALLVPPRWIDFNAAARETERSGRDRGFVSYVRGAWADQKDIDSGEIATQYLRPSTTWSALGLSYENALNQRVVLVHLFWIRGNSTATTDVKHHYLIFERPFDLRELNSLEELRLGIDTFRETRHMSMLEEHIAALKVRRQGLTGEIVQREGIVNNHASALRDLEQQHRAMGGDLIERWEAEKSDLEIRRDECVRKSNLARQACSKLNWVLPDTPGGFAELVGKSREEIEDWQRDAGGTDERRFSLDRERTQARTRLAAAEAEVAALRRQPSSISADMLDMRRSIASALGLAESALPFAGELIEVRARDSEWRGAIERVLHGFALSLLVDDEHYAALSSHVNGVNLGRRLVYYRCGRAENAQARHVASNSLASKLDIKSCEYSSWLRAELAQRFDYACVDSMQAFRSSDRALTRQGQVRHSRAPHEKDDRRDVNDRRSWVLGFDNRDKLALFEAQVRELRDTVARLDDEITRLSKEDQERAARAIQCQTLANMQWQEIDVGPVLDRIATLERQLREARDGNSALGEMSRRIGESKEKLSVAEIDLRETKSVHSAVEKELETQSAKLRTLQEDPTIISLTPHQARGLNERFEAQGVRLTLDNLDEVSRRVERGIGEEIKGFSEQINSLEKAVENRFIEFKRRWLMDAADTDTTIASAPDHLARLLRLETDGLPAHEQRFFELLRNQSHQNLAALSTHLNQARKAILERMAQVNESLRHAPFNPGTHLHIEVSDRQLPEVRELRQEILQALSHAWGDDQEGAEARFVVLRGLVERLTSQDPEQRRWRESVLDVRQHVEFIGQELDENEAPVEVYRSGAGKSGGQRQKLATTCLAAALRYQLGSNEQGAPIYAPVVLDEAFDKADNEFTALAMNIFVNFGFQMIVATPLKSVMTLEPFIGGACFVEIRERRHSAILLIEYDETRNRLRLPEHTRDGAIVEIS